MIRRLVRWLAWVLFREPAARRCVESRGLGLADHHDYRDSVEGEPWHFTTLRCRRCGKSFTI